jgi:hypothetical protein
MMEGLEEYKEDSEEEWMEKLRGMWRG